MPICIHQSIAKQQSCASIVCPFHLTRRRKLRAAYDALRLHIPATLSTDSFACCDLDLDADALECRSFFKAACLDGGGGARSANWHAHGLFRSIRWGGDRGFVAAESVYLAIGALFGIWSFGGSDDWWLGNFSLIFRYCLTIVLWSLGNDDWMHNNCSAADCGFILVLEGLVPVIIVGARRDSHTSRLFRF